MGCIENAGMPAGNPARAETNANGKPRDPNGAGLPLLIGLFARLVGNAAAGLAGALAGRLAFAAAAVAQALGHIAGFESLDVLHNNSHPFYIFNLVHIQKNDAARSRPVTAAAVAPGLVSAVFGQIFRRIVFPDTPQGDTALRQSHAPRRAQASGALPTPASAGAVLLCLLLYTEAGALSRKRRTNPARAVRCGAGRAAHGGVPRLFGVQMRQHILQAAQDVRFHQLPGAGGVAGLQRLQDPGVLGHADLGVMLLRDLVPHGKPVP